MVRGSSLRVRAELLGPLRVLVDDAPIDVRGPKQRAVLAMLAFAEGRTVSIDLLVDALWPSVPPSARQTLHSHVSRLRTQLGPAADRLETRQDGYRLELGADGLDVARARALLAEARARLPQDAAGAFAGLQEAYALWRGPLLADLTDVAPIAAAVEACGQLHRDVSDALVASGIAAGRADEVLGLAASSRAADPLREPSVLLHMKALAATGQAPEALRVAREYRRMLADETGLDPSRALGDLERDIAAGKGPAPATGTRTASRQRPVDPTAGQPPGRLIGRDAQLAALHRLLAAEQLVTVVGPGGVGKTRLAMEVARRSRGVTVLLLAPVTDPAALPHALAAALNLETVQGDVLSACVAMLGEQPGLLVVDNCEHLLDAVRDMVGLILSACPGRSVLATSREPLGLAEEHTSRLAPLALPSSGGDLREVPSVAVFLDRASRVRAGAPPTDAELPTVADIVRRLDGMPLAIELAAGRLSTFSLADLHNRLDRSLDLLGGGRLSGEARHRTLRATMEWSYQLLAEDEKLLFRHLAAFVDGLTLDNAERLAAELGLTNDPGSTLARLVDASMVEAHFEGGTRYRMLETLRAFGQDRLAAAGEAEAAHERMLRWAVELSAWIGSTMATEREPEADAIMRRELPNLRAAWRLARDLGAVDDAVAMITTLYDTVTYRDLIEIRGWAEELADDPALIGHPGQAAVLGTAAEAAYHRGAYPRTDQLARAGLAVASDDLGSWLCLTTLSVADLARGAYDDVVEHSLAAAAVAPRPRENLGVAALAHAYAGDTREARRLNDLGRRGGVAPTLLSWGEYVGGEIEGIDGNLEIAEEHYVRAIDHARASGATFLVGVATVGLVSTRAAAGRIGEALHGYREVIDYFARTGNWTHQWVALRNLADLLRRLGDEEPARLIEAAAIQAPDAPADGSAAEDDRPAAADDLAQRDPAAVAVSRAGVLQAARGAIDRHLRDHDRASSPVSARAPGEPPV